MTSPSCSVFQMVKVGRELMRGEGRHSVWNELLKPRFEENSPQVEAQKTTVALPPEDFAGAALCVRGRALLLQRTLTPAALTNNESPKPQLPCLAPYLPPRTSIIKVAIDYFSG